LTEISVEAFRNQFAISGPSQYLFPSDENAYDYQKTFKTVWHATLRRTGVRYFRIYDLRSTYATRPSAGGVADEWVTQLLRQGDAKVSRKYSQMLLLRPEPMRQQIGEADEFFPVCRCRREPVVKPRIEHKIPP
jgi:integrase